jgi:hypothetical protein
VLLHNKRSIIGCIAMCNLQYNIAIIAVESLDLPMVALNDPPGCYSMLTFPVIAVGRDSKSLRVKHGDMIRERSKLDCSELLVCTCPVSKVKRNKVFQIPILKEKDVSTNEMPYI